jgi:uncharacterized metal-binding protein YceD (DUF177 family)
MAVAIKNKLHIREIRLKEGKQSYKENLNAEELDLSNLIFKGPIAIDAELNKSGDTVVLSGKVNFRLELECVNCLEKYEKDFSQELYQEYVKTGQPMASESARLDDVDFVREFYTGDFIDLTALIHDTILLAIPIAGWCREDCSGVKE